MALFIGNYLSLLTKLVMVIIIMSYTLFQIAFLNNITFFIDNIEVLNQVSSRIDGIKNDDGVIEERGYQRVLSYPQYIIYGAGEGAHWRYAGKLDPSAGNRELHSGLATILMSYGFFGFILFATFIFTIFQRAPWLLWFTLAAVMAYGITHQHIRFTAFWVYLGIMYATTRYVIPQRIKSDH